MPYKPQPKKSGSAKPKTYATLSVVKPNKNARLEVVKPKAAPKGSMKKIVKPSEPASRRKIVKPIPAQPPRGRFSR